MQNAESLEPQVALRRSSSYYRPDIQGLRALAVLLVVLAHAGVPHLGGGYIGVDVFFVISGYVITGLLRRQPDVSIRKNLGGFYSRRIRRIVPASSVVLIATVVAAYAWLGASTGVPLLTDVRWAEFFGANWRFIATSSSYFIPGVPPSLVTQYWSLGVEEQFYIVFPLIVFTIGLLFGARRRATVLAVVLVAAVIVSSWWSIHLTGINATEAYYSPFTRFWELALGGLLTLGPPRWAQRTPRLNALLAVGALVAIALSAFWLTDLSAYPGALAWWPCAAAAVLLWTGQASARGGPATWLSWRPVTYVGDVSYSAVRNDSHGAVLAAGPGPGSLRMCSDFLPLLGKSHPALEMARRAALGRRWAAGGLPRSGVRRHARLRRLLSRRPPALSASRNQVKTSGYAALTGRP
jgi:peptidoglycan/LPS O-acetylase OafA/YrhL